jgi:cardiolipin synthase
VRGRLAAAGQYLTRQYAPTAVALPAALPENRTCLLVNGHEALPALQAMIASARHSIRWQVMLFHPDEIGERLGQALASAARRGVKVQLSFGIAQSMNGSPADRFSQETKQHNNQQMRRLLGVLRGAGVEVRENPPGNRFGLDAANPRARAIQAAINRSIFIPANHYDHRKLLVVDGQTAMVGGMNVGRHYLYGIAPDLALTMSEEALQRQQHALPEAWEKWLDVSMMVEGPLVSAIAAAFDWKWEVLGGASLAASDREQPQPAQSKPNAGWLEHISGQFLEQRPGHPEISTRFFELVESAQRELWLASPFISYTPALDALRAAARRGVQVVLIAPDTFQEMPVSGRLFRESVPDLLKDGVEVWFNVRRMAHSKVLVADRRVTLSGSFNLNFRSFLHDLEAALVLEDASLAENVMQRVFMPYLTISRRVENLRRPPINLVNWLIRPFS